MKKTTTIRLDKDILEQARKNGFTNLSFHVERWLLDWTKKKSEQHVSI